MNSLRFIHDGDFGDSVAKFVNKLRRACASVSDLNSVHPIVECEKVYLRSENPYMQVLEKQFHDISRTATLHDFLRTGVLHVLRILNMEISMYQVFFQSDSGASSMKDAATVTEAFDSMAQNIVNCLYVDARPTILARPKSMICAI